MKLYATITSERASKGQGGNRIIVTNFNCGEDRKWVLKVQMERAVGETRIEVTDIGKNELVFSKVIPDELKGEKKKGDGWCRACDIGSHSDMNKQCPQ